MAISFPYSNNYEPPAPTLEIKILSPESRKFRVIETLVDTGADASLIPKSILEELEAHFLQSKQMRGILGQTFTVDVYMVTLEVGGQRLRGVTVVGIEDGKEEPIVGRNILNRLFLLFNGPHERLDVIEPE